MRSLADLSHIELDIPGGGNVLVLDTGALIDPESQALIAARYSRSIKGAKRLIEELFNRDVGAFMRENYKAGYGHKSIAELGDAAIFVDGVSMLCAKAIQHFPLYRGQESSTRYIDFSKQRLVNPLGSDEGNNVLEDWRAFYLRGLDIMIPELKLRYPRDESEDEQEYVKTIKARAFDIMRSFLPAGSSTNVAWAGDLRHINDHLMVLRHHPLEEVRNVAETIEQALLQKFPDSFSAKRYEASETYLNLMGKMYQYFDPSGHPEFALKRDALDYDLLDGYTVAIVNRPPKTELPWDIRECGTLSFEYLLDFGSFRDLERQRAVIVPMPLLTSDFGFEEWYLDELPENFAKEAREFIQAQIERVGHLVDASMPDEAPTAQYYLPMGMRVPIRLTGDLRGLVYLIELRSTRFVHPTLVHRTRQKAKVLMGLMRAQRIDIPLHMDPEPNRFDVKRGTHDFVAAR